MSENNTFNNLNFVFNKNEGVSESISINTSTVGISLQYDKNTANPKTFSIRPSGVNFTDNTNNFTTALERLALVQQAFQAVELPTEPNSLEIKNTLKIDASGNVANVKMDLNTGVQNNIILNNTYALDSTLPYPVGGSENNFITKISRESDDSVLITAPKDISLVRCADPSFNTVDLNVTTTDFGTLPVAGDYGVANTTCSAVFPNNKFIYANTNYTTKIFYLQDFSSNAFSTIDISSVTTGSANYSTRISVLGIAQFIPVFYTSATNCKFYIRLQDNSAATNLYFITCDGDPSLMASYTWGTNWAQASGIVPPNQLANGDPYVPVAFTNGLTINSQRLSVIYYDAINDLFIVGTTASSTTGNFYTITNSNITTVANYPSIVPTGFTSTSVHMYNSVENTKIFAKVFNNNNSSLAQIQIGYWDGTSLRISPNYDVATALGGLGTFNNIANMDMAFVDVSMNEVSVYFPWVINVASPLSQNLNLALINWDKNIANSPTFVRTIQVNTLTGAQTQQSLGYPSIRAYSQNVVEVVNPLTDTYFISNDAIVSGLTKTSIGVLSTYLAFTNGEGETNTTARSNIIKPIHYYVRGSAITNMTNIALVTIANNQPTSPTEYLSFTYASSDLSTTITAPNGDLILNPTGAINANGKTLDMTNGEIHKVPLIHGPNNQNLVIEAKGSGDLIFETNGVNRMIIGDNGVSTFTTLPQSFIAPSFGQDFCNKAYVDSVASGGAPPTPTSFTPTLFFGGTLGTVTYTTQVGTSIQIGKLVVFQATIACSSVSGAGAITVSIPAQPSFTGGAGCVGFISGLTSGGSCYSITFQASSFQARVREKITAAATTFIDLDRSKIGNSFNITYSGAYISN